MEDLATIKQVSYLMYLLEQQGMIRNIRDYEKFEEVVKKDLFKLTKKEASGYIEKLKEDRKWMESITNQILGTH
jgi:hypothetical protein